MALKIRLRQQGRTNRLMYRVVVTDSRTKRDGAYVEALGWYNPHEKNAENQMKIDSERAGYWIEHGAQMTEKVVSLMRRSAPEVVQAIAQREDAKRAKARARRKARKAA